MRVSMSSACLQVHLPLFGLHGGIGNNRFHRPKDKVVFVVGATGTVKSRLAIDVAFHFQAEIINTDKMQAYKGLDIVTNKVPHHPFGFVDPELDFTATDFRHSTWRAIESILGRDRRPIIAGGSNSFIDALVNDIPEFRLRHQCCFLWVDREVESGFDLSSSVNCQDGCVSSSYNPLPCQSKHSRLNSSGSCTRICYSPRGYHNHCDPYSSNSFIRTVYFIEVATDCCFQSTNGSNTGCIVFGGIIFSCEFNPLLQGLAMCDGHAVPLNLTLLKINKAGNGATKLSRLNANTVMETSVYRAVTSTSLIQGKYPKRVSSMKTFEHCFNVGVGSTRVGPAVPEIDLPLGGVSCRILFGFLIYFAFSLDLIRSVANKIFGRSG